MKTTIRLTLVVVGCSREISRQEFRERNEELQADLFAGGGGETVREYRELAARPPDRALRDSAEALVGEIDGLFDGVITLRKEIRELTVPEPEDDRPRFSFGLPRRDQVQAAADAVDSAEQQRDGRWQEIRAELVGETIEAVDNGMRRGAAEKRAARGHGRTRHPRVLLHPVHEPAVRRAGGMRGREEDETPRGDGCRVSASG